MAFKDIRLPDGDRLFAGRYMGLFTGVKRREMFLKKTAELMGITLGNQDLSLIVDDLYSLVDSGIDSFRHGLQGFLRYNGI